MRRPPFLTSRGIIFIICAYAPFRHLFPIAWVSRKDGKENVMKELIDYRGDC